MPPVALACATASLAPSRADLPSAAAKPVSGTFKPIFTSACAAPARHSRERNAVRVSAVFMGFLSSSTSSYSRELQRVQRGSERKSCDGPGQISTGLHRQGQAVLAGALLRDLIAGIGVAHHAGSRVVPEHALDALGR